MKAIKVKAGVPQTMDDIDNRTFAEWMESIDRLIMSFYGLSVYDLPDCPFREAYKAALAEAIVESQQQYETAALEHS